LIKKYSELCELSVSGGEKKFGYLTAEARRTPRRDLIRKYSELCELCVLCGES
jgi:hypothetical protein